MSPERWERIQEALFAALEHAPHEREAFLAEACAGDAELRSEIHALLEAHEQAGSFLQDDPIPAPAPSTSSPERVRHLRHLFEELIGLEPDERAAHLDCVCSGDDALRRDVGSLLQAYDDASEIVYAHDRAAVADAYVSRTISHYQITEKLGGGGMGVVYRARDIRLDRIVALKFLPPHLSADPEAKERLLHEARAASALDHVNICTIHEIGETEEEQLFIAMACYSGETLKKKVARGALPTEEALDYAVQMAQGLAKAHEQGIVHRDIKPANVMVTEDGVVKLLDFGLAKATGVSLTKEGALLGTVAYMSPEQSRGKAIDQRTDIWSLGVVLYEMITGRRPFRGDYEQAVIYAILNEEPEPLAGVRPETARVLDPIVRKMLAKRPEDRYDAVEALIGDLRETRRAVSGLVAESEGLPRSARRSVRGELLPDGERVQATVVVSNLVGYADLIEQLSPDDLDAMMRKIRSRVVDIVQHHGGVVNRFAGEEMIAFFGVPTPREDDCARSARAVRELHAWVREFDTGSDGIRLSSGIDTGLVVAQPLDRTEEPYRVVGSTMKVAAALARHAKADEILVSPESRRLLARFFETERLAPLHVEGRTERMAPCRVVGDSQRHDLFDPAERPGLTAHLGREQELETLRHCLDRTAAGEGQLVAVMGEAGLGKSRLLYEFRRELEANRVGLLQGRCSSFGGRIAYLPFIELLRQHLGIDEGATPHSADAVAARILELDQDLRPYVPLYLNLLSRQSDAHPLPEELEGEDLRAATLEALAAVFTLSSRPGPLVLYLEDWHWSDEASRDALNRLVELIPAYPLLVVVAYRPEFTPGWGHPAYQTSIRLRQFDEASSAEMIRCILGAGDVPVQVAALLHERTDGNPFFLEEICQALREEGTLQVEEGGVILTRSVEKRQLPATVQAVIRTRLHRLDGRVRSVLCLASIAGREFTGGLIRTALADGTDLSASLEALRSAGLIQQTRVLPEAAYRFKHVLTQEVAYDSLLRHQRKRMHGLVGRALEERLGDRPEEQADVLAHHFSEAERWRKAIHYSLAAADRAVRMSRFSEAHVLYEQVRTWIDLLPEDTDRLQTGVDLLLRVERLHDAIGGREDQQAAIDELLGLLEFADDLESLAEVQIRQGDLHTLLARFEEAEVVLQEALRVSRARGYVTGEQKALRSMAFLRWLQNRHEDAAKIIEKSLAIDREQGDADELATDLHNLLRVLSRLGQFERGMTYVEELLSLNEKLRDTGKRCSVLGAVSTIYRALGDVENALFYNQRGIEEAEQDHRVTPLLFLLASRAQMYFEQGQLEKSVRLYKELIEQHRRSKLPIGRLGFSVGPHGFGTIGLGGPLRVLGEMLLALERYEEALPYLEEAASCFAEMSDREAEAALQSKVATVCERQGKLTEAQATWEDVRSLHRNSGSPAGECEALMGIGRTARLQKNPDRALQCYAEALALAERMGDDSKEGELRNVMGIITWEHGAYGEALRHYERALQIFRERDEPANSGLMMNSIGVTLQKLGRSEEAVGCLEEAVQLHRRSGQPKLEAHALAALGDVYCEMGRHSEALPYYGASLQLRWNLSDRRGEGWMFQRLARSYAAQGEVERAGTTLEQAAEIAAEVEDEELLKTCRR